MKRLRIAAVIVIVLALFLFGGMLLYKHLITDQIRDKGGMMNPKYVEEADNAAAVGQTENGAPQ